MGKHVNSALACCLAALMLMAAPAFGADREVYVYNWADYVAPDTIQNFERETGIKVVYDIYDSYESLDAKVLTGNTSRLAYIARSTRRS